MKTLTLADGRVLTAMPHDRDEPILARGVRTEDKFPHTKHIAWWKHPECIREFDGANWSILPIPRVLTQRELQAISDARFGNE